MRPAHIKPVAATTAKNRYVNQIGSTIRRSQPRQGRGVRLRQTTRGIIIEADPSEGGGKPPPSSWYRGDWRSDTNYSTGEGVSIRGGLTAGLYLALTDVAAGQAPPSPADVTKWVRVATDNPMGGWI